MGLSLARTSRAQLWWAAKLPPVVALQALGAVTAGVPAGRGLSLMAATFVSAIGIAVGSHLVNDWSDIDADAAAGKPNVLAQLSGPARSSLVAAAGLVGAVPWAIVGPGVASIAILVALGISTIAYSCPPIRLKGRGLAGILADAANAHVLPAMFVLILMGEAGTRTGWWTVATVAALAWATGFGVRSIVVHQRIDVAGDRTAGVRTFVATHRGRNVRDIGLTAFKLELLGLVGLVAATAATAPFVAAFSAVYLLFWCAYRRHSTVPLDPLPSAREAWMPLAEYYEVWPAATLALHLAVQDVGWWPLPVAFGAAFAATVAKQAVDLVRMMRSVLGELARMVDFACWRFRVSWYDGRMSRVRYSSKDSLIRGWLFCRRQGRRARRHVKARLHP